VAKPEGCGPLFELNPSRDWQDTGLVNPGETGPGCAVNCIYCNQMGMDVGAEGNMSPILSGMVDGGLSINTRLYVGSKLQKKVTLEQVERALHDWPLYTQKSPLLLENFNDPGNNWQELVFLVEMLMNTFHHQGPIAFITKMGIKESEAKRLGDLKESGAKLIGIVTYSNMPQKIENSSSHVRLKTIQRLHQVGLPVIVSIRPLIRGINDSPENIKLILNQISGYADGVMAGGLFVFDNFTFSAFEKAGYPLDDFYKQDGYPPAKKMASGYKELVMSLMTELKHPSTFFYHTSCAIATIANLKYANQEPDRLTHWIEPTGQRFGACCSKCPMEQKQICQSACKTPQEEIVTHAKTALSRLGYINADTVLSTDVPNTILVVNHALTFDELLHVKECCGWDVLNLPTSDQMVYKIFEAIASDATMNRPDLLKNIIRVELIGQQWFITVGGVEQNLAKLMEKWIRGRSRHRAHIISQSAEKFEQNKSSLFEHISQQKDGCIYACAQGMFQKFLPPFANMAMAMLNQYVLDDTSQNVHMFGTVLVASDFGLNTAIHTKNPVNEDPYLAHEESKTNLLIMEKIKSYSGKNKLIMNSGELDSESFATKVKLHLRSGGVVMVLLDWNKWDSQSAEKFGNKRHVVVITSENTAGVEVMDPAVEAKTQVSLDQVYSCLDEKQWIVFFQSKCKN